MHVNVHEQNCGRLTTMVNMISRRTILIYLCPATDTSRQDVYGRAEGTAGTPAQDTRAGNRECKL